MISFTFYKHSNDDAVYVRPLRKQRKKIVFLAREERPMYFKG